MFWRMISQGSRRSVKGILEQYFAVYRTDPLIAVSFKTLNNVTLQEKLNRRHFTPNIYVPCRPKTTKMGKRNKKMDKRVKNLVEDLESDDEDEDLDTEVYEEIEETVNADSPVAKFITDFQKQGKKGQVKGVRAKGTHVQSVTYHEVKGLIDIDRMWKELEKETDELKDHFARHLNLRSVIAIDDLKVELEGDVYPLHELTSISKRDPKRIVIDCSSFPQATINIMTALRNSGMNLNPQQEELRIYVPLPKVTKEYREKLAKGAKSAQNSTKEKLRNIYSKYLSKLEDLEHQHKRSLDIIIVSKDLLYAMVDHFSREVETLTTKKQKEIMGGK